MEINLKIPIFAALDLDSKVDLLNLAEQISPFVGGLKIGPRICMKYGESIVRDLASLAPVFVDNKYYDIPNTMEASVRATFNAGASFCTIHAGSGAEALNRIRELEKELNQTRPFKILCVTVLTSFSEQNQPAHWSERPIKKQVQALAQQTQDLGLSGLVCSASEVSEMRREFPEAYLVTPGIRLQALKNDDQKRVMTPKRALEEGASALVIGRPIYKAEDPEQAARSIFESL